MRRLPPARFVLKTDVASEYASIDHVNLLGRWPPGSATRAY